jgi:transcriptional regulator with XRE-family HTH domain
MNAPGGEEIGGQASLSDVLKALRHHRRLRSATVAEAMGMPLRSYEHFESGAGRMNRDRIHRFADAIDVDPYAIFVALDIGSPEFAIRCADNKLMMILTMALLEFDLTVGDGIQRLETTQVIEAFTSCFDGLHEKAKASEAFVETWMAEKALPNRPPSD